MCQRPAVVNARRAVPSRDAKHLFVRRMRTAAANTSCVSGSQRAGRRGRTRGPKGPWGLIGLYSVLRRRVQVAVPLQPETTPTAWN